MPRVWPDAGEPVCTGVRGLRKEIQGLIDKMGPLGLSQKESPEHQVSAAEFILEGLHAHKRIGRNEERIFKAGEKKPEPVREKTFEAEDKPYRQRRQFN